MKETEKTAHMYSKKRKEKQYMYRHKYMKSILFQGFFKTTHYPEKHINKI